MAVPTDALALRIAAHVSALCKAGVDRFLGTDANALAVAHVADSMRQHGLAVESLPFETVGWRRGSARIEFDGQEPKLHVGPFSPPMPRTTLPLTAVSTPAALAELDARGAALLLYGQIAAEQLTPRGYPFYDNPEHTAILDAIERAAPVAIIAATGKNPASTAALSPFPLVEDGTFPLPSTYLAEADIAPLLDIATRGGDVTVSIDSGRCVSRGEQLVGRLGDPGAGRRIIVCAHIDTKPDTPGALDNATGVATLLAAAELLAEDPPPGLALEFVPFNGEDHFADLVTHVWVTPDPFRVAGDRVRRV